MSSLYFLIGSLLLTVVGLGGLAYKVIRETWKPPHKVGTDDE